MDLTDMPDWHLGECDCDEGEYLGDPIHRWDCGLLRCLLAECRCEEIGLELLEEDRLRYLEG